MLQFSGDAFTTSTKLYDNYLRFIATNGSDSFFMNLKCKIDWNAVFFSFKNIDVQVGDFSLRKTNIEDMFHVKCLNCCFIVRDAFSCMQWSEKYLRDLTDSTYDQLNEGVYQIARFRALYLNMLVLHASAVVYNDEAILFSGVKGAGKSTQARLWLENTDAWVLNYDKPVVKLDEERVLVSGSPWGGKEDLAINEVRPAKALFFVHQAKENRVVRLSSGMAYAQAHLNYFVYPLNEDIEKRYNDSIIRLIKKIPVYDLYCTDTAEAVFTVKRVLYPEEE